MFVLLFCVFWCMQGDAWKRVGKCVWLDGMIDKFTV